MIFRKVKIVAMLHREIGSKLNNLRQSERKFALRCWLLWEIGKQQFRWLEEQILTIQVWLARWQSGKVHWSLYWSMWQPPSQTIASKSRSWKILTSPRRSSRPRIFLSASTFSSLVSSTKGLRNDSLAKLFKYSKIDYQWQFELQLHFVCILF